MSKKVSIKEKGVTFWNDFKAFAFKGNVLDMAVGVIVATAFTKIVNSLVNDVFMPFISWEILPSLLSRKVLRNSYNAAEESSVPIFSSISARMPPIISSIMVTVILSLI